MAADNDSGSPFFFKQGGTWQLSGIAVSVGYYDGQPSGTGMFGNSTVYMDLTAYRDQILTIIPEPASVLLALILLITVTGYQWVFRKRCCRNGP